jgi:hypothetical protein
MKRSWALSVCFLLTLVATAACAQDLVATYPGKGVFTTTGTWRFHTGDDLHWLAPTFDDSTWEQLSADEPWGAQTHPGYTGFAWYRRQIDIANVTGPLSIYLPQIDSAYELYFNGQRIGGFGQLPPHAVWDANPFSNVFPLPKPDATGHLRGVLTIRVWKAMLGSADPLDGGGLNGPPLIGDSQVLTNTVALQEGRSERRNLIRIIECAIFFIVSVVAIGMWAFDRSRKLHLWLGIFLLGGAGQVSSAFPDLQRVDVFQWAQLHLTVTGAARDLGIWMLILVLFGLDRETFWRRTTAILAAVYLLARALDLMTAFDWASGWEPLRTIDGVTTAIWCALPLYLFVLLAAGLRRRRDLALLPTVLACATLEAYNLIVNALGQGIQFTHLNFQKIFTAATIHLGPYNFNLRSQLQAVVLVVLVATIYRQQTRERRRQLFVESELKSAQEIQNVLVPEETPSVPGFAISSLYWPAGEVGGDMFQVIPGPTGDVLIILADVSGKGLKAAMTVSLLVGAVRTLADITSNPLTILSTLNQRLIGRSNGGFTTCLVLHVSSTGMVTLANAGHLPPFLNGEAIPLEGSLPLGLLPGTDFPITHFQLNQGDDLTLYTDGVLEAQRESGELFGFDRTAQLLSSRPSVRTIAETARTFGQVDDITVIKIARTPTTSTQTHISIDLQTAAI